MEHTIQKRSRIFVNFSLSFLLFIIIPVLILNIAIWLTIRVTERDERQHCVNLISEGMGRMDAQIRDIQNIVTFMRRDSAITALEHISSDITASDHFNIWLAIQSLGRMDITGRGLDMLLYYKNSDLALSPDFMAGPMNNAWGSSFHFGNYTYADFLDTFCFSGYRPVFFPAMDFIWENIPSRGILYGLRLNINSEAFIFSLLREENIESHFSQVFSNGGALYIYDAAGAMLYSRGGGFPPGKFDTAAFSENGLLPAGFFGPGIIGAYSHSDNGLFYVSALETNTVLHRVRYLWNLALILNIATIVLTVGYALFLAAWNVRQIGEVFQLLNKTHGLPSYEKGNVLRYLNNSVKRLVNANIKLKKDADSRKEILRIGFLDRFLNDGWKNAEEAAIVAKHAGVEITERRFCIIFIVIGGPSKNGKNNEEEISYQIRDTLRNVLPPDEALIYNRNPNRLGIFFFLKPEHWENFRGYIEGLFQNSVIPSAGLPAGLNDFSLQMTGSRLYEDIFEIREGYRLCREYALVHENRENARINWVDLAPQLSARQRIFVFPPDIEQKIINQIKSADFENAQNNIRSLFAANLQESRLSERMLMIFYTNLQSCFLKSLDGPLTDLWRDAIEDLDFNRLPREVEETFIELARCICVSAQEEYTKSNAAVKKEDLTQWVEEHFGEEQLSLSLAARHFGFSEPYFSQMFKEITGENFSAFTEHTRLNHAQILLKQFLKVEEVAYRCGYSSPNTFRRAYKRHFGINPTRTRS